MSGTVKLILASAALVVMAAALATALEGARRRAQLTHCRNNLRRLGQDANEYLAGAEGPLRRKVIKDWERATGRTIDLGRRGRGFWQAVRLVLYSKKTPPSGVRYDVHAPDMFDCPVNGLRTPPAWDAPETIDYRGPAADFPPEDLAAWDFRRPFAADRAGNHGAGEGGFALYLSLEVRPAREPELVVERISGEAEAWKEAAASTTD